jgi:hypothetical protein
MPLPALDVRGRRPSGCAGPPQESAYSSRMIERYCAFLKKHQSPVLLDVGPVSGGNISFFAEHAGKIYVCDLMRRLAGSDPAGPRTGDIAGILDYRPGSLDGIHLWDLPSHVNDKTLQGITQHCRVLLKRHGFVMVIAKGKPDPEPFENYLLVNNNLSVTLTKSTARSFPHFYRSNRDIELAMKPLEQHTSFMCMNGWREFLFR